MTRRALFPLALACFASVLSCGREVTAPQGELSFVRSRPLLLAPEFPSAYLVSGAADLVPFTRVRFVLTRVDKSIALDKVVDFPSGQEQLNVDLTVPLSPSAGEGGEVLTLNIEYVNTSGEVVFKGGPVDVNAKPPAPAGSTTPDPPPIVVPVRYSGPGATATKISIAPKTGSGLAGQTLNFSATALLSDAAVAGTPIIFTSLDPSRASVPNAATGAVTLGPQRGEARIVAQLLNGAADTARIDVSLPPSAVQIVSGDNQRVVSGAMMTLPLTARVVATDGLPVAHAPVEFVIEAGGGALSSVSARSDAEGLVSARWTVGNTVGTGRVRVTATGVPAATATFVAQIGSPAPTRLEFSVSPASAKAGQSLGDITVRALDGAGSVATSFTGSITLNIGTNPSSGTLSGTASRSATAGVAVFPGLSIDKRGSGYTLEAKANGLTTASSAAFDVSEGTAVRLRFVDQPSSIVAGRTFTTPITVDAIDAGGNVVTGFTGEVKLFIWLNPGSGTFIGTDVVRAVNGRATFPGLSINRAGVNYALGASSTGLTNGGSTTFDVTAGAASRTVLTSGGGQSGPSGAPLTDSIGVFVSDELGNPIANVPVTFTPASGHGTASPSVTPTNAQGIAKTRWTLAGAAGTKSMTITGPGAPVTATATAVGVASGGPTRVLFALESTAIGRNSFSAITVFLNAPAVVPTTVTLGVLDALSQWSTSTVTIAAGASSAIANWKGVALGTTRGTVSAPGLGIDTIVATVQTASMSLMNSYMGLTVGDSAENSVTLSEPAPAGGLTIAIDATGSGMISTAPSAGDSYGAGDPYSGYDLRANAAAGPSLTVRAGETRAYFKLFGLSAGTVTLTLSAPNFASHTANVYVTATGLSSYGDTAVAAVGTESQREWYFDASSSTDRTVSYLSLDPGIVSISGPSTVVRNNDYFYAKLRGITPGVGRVVVASPGMKSDTMFVAVTEPRLRFQMFCINYSCYNPRNFSMYAGEEREGRVLLIDSLGNTVRAVAPVTVSLTTTDAASAIPTVSAVTIDVGQSQSAFGVRALAMGTPWLLASAPAVRTDTSQGSIVGPLVQLSGVGDVGIGQFRTFIVDGVRPAPDATTITLTSSNPAVVDVPPVVTLAAGSTSVGGIRLIGRASGTATITATIPGVGSATSGLLRVSPTKLVISCWSNCSPATGGSSGTWRVQVRDSLNVARPILGNLALTFSSSDTTKLAPTYSSTIIYEGNADGFVSAVGRATGTVRLRVAAPGYAPESISVTVPAGVSTPKIEFALGSTARVGRAQRIPNAYLYRSGFDTAARVVTLTKLGGATTLSTTTLTFPSNSPYTQNFRIDAVTNGVDTLIATAPGMSPDSVVIRISSPRFAVSGFPTNAVVGYPYASVYIGLADSTGTSNYAGARTIVTITSSDTLVVKPTRAVDTLEVDDYEVNVPLQYRSPGTATITVATASGYATYVSPTITVAAQQLQFSYSSITLGMRQQTYAWEGYVYSSYPVLQPTWVRLTPSAAGLISIPDSVRFETGESYAYFSIAGLDTVGGLRITASAPGFNSRQMDVYVTKPAAVLCCNTSAYLGRGSRSMELLLGTTGGYEHNATAPVTFTLSSSAPTVALIAPATVTVPAGSSSADFDATLLGLGDVTITANDNRSTFNRYLEGSSSLQVLRSVLSASSSMSLGPNIEREMDLYADNRAAPLTVSWTKSGAGATTLASSGSFVLPANVAYHTPLTIRSTTTIGADTIIFTAPNWTPDTLVVRSGTGTIYTGSIPSSITSGSATSFYLSAGSPNGYYSYDNQAVALPITLSCTSGCSWINPSTLAVVTSVTIPAGSNYVTAALRGNSAGVATYTITAPGYASVSRTISVLPASP